MKKELGFGRCGLACVLCGQNVNCSGCDSGGCPGSSWCENRRCIVGDYDDFDNAEELIKFIWGER